VLVRGVSGFSCCTAAGFFGARWHISSLLNLVLTLSGQLFPSAVHNSPSIRLLFFWFLFMLFTQCHYQSSRSATKRTGKEWFVSRFPERERERDNAGLICLTPW
jgi:hypothetical protein